MRDLWLRRRHWRVDHTTQGDGLTAIDVTARDTGERRQFLLPNEPHVAARPPAVRRVRRQQALARLAAHVRHTHLAFSCASAVDAQVALHSYQLEPALAWLAGRRRLLLADAVGLGKTIQAGLIISSSLAHTRDARVLVLAPASLLDQWQDELSRRFDIPSRVGDSRSLAGLRAELPYLASPWLLPGVWLTTPDFVKQPHVYETLPGTAWDLVVADEAHQLSGLSLRRDALDTLARRARSVVLLTATPHDGDDARYARLLSLGARCAADRLTVFRRVDRPPGPGRRTRWLHVRLSTVDLRVLRTIDQFERSHRSAAARGEGLALLCAVFRRRALSSVAALRASVARRLQHLATPATPGWHQATLFDVDVCDAEDTAAIQADSLVPVTTERAWLLRLEFLCAGATDGGRATALRTLLRRTREPAVVFTRYRDTLTALAALLPGRRLACLHGGMSRPEINAALSAFLDGRADTLLATDVASQGLNLQSRARWVISFDVPATPLRAEQRIGRVDRLGQTRRVHATLFTSRHNADVIQRDALAARESRSDSAVLPLCSRWTRVAGGLCRWFIRQRALAAHWRPTDPPDAVTVAMCPTRFRRLFGLPPMDTQVTCARLVAADGNVVEQRLVLTRDAESETAVRAQLERRARALSARMRVRARFRARLALPDVAAQQPGLFVTTPAVAATAVRPGSPAPEPASQGDFSVRVELTPAVLVVITRGRP